MKADDSYGGGLNGHAVHGKLDDIPASPAVIRLDRIATLCDRISNSLESARDRFRFGHESPEKVDRLARALTQAETLYRVARATPGFSVEFLRESLASARSRAREAAIQLHEFEDALAAADKFADILAGKK